MVISFSILATSSSKEVNSYASLTLFRLAQSASTSLLSVYECADSCVYLWFICVILAP